MTILGGNLETKEIGLPIGLSGLYSNTEIDKETGFLRLKAIDVTGGDKPIYADEGFWLSDPIDLGDNFLDFEKVFLTNTDNGSSSVAVLTRVSDDGIEWSDWLAIAYDGAIQSDTKRYIQIQVNLFAGYKNDNILINKDNYTINNNFVETKTLSEDGYIPLAFASNTATSVGFPFSSSNYSSSYYAYKAFDGSTSTGSQFRSSGTESNNFKLGFCFTAPMLFTKYTLVISEVKSCPVNWVFQGSNDTTTGLDGTWVDLDTQSNIAWSSAPETKEFSFSNTIEYKAYRLHVTKNNGHTAYASLGELKFYKPLETYLQIKRDYEFDMTQDTTWLGGGSLHRKTITREEWLRIDRLEVTQ